MSYEYSEDRLVQQTTANYLHDALGWDSVYAFDQETLGPRGTLGRKSQREVVLTRYLAAKIREFNGGLPDAVYADAIAQVTAVSAAKSTLQHNQEKYTLLREGVPVTWHTEDGRQRSERLRLFDFKQPANNHFLAVRELWVQGPIYRRRPDLIGFVNGIPLLLIECKAHYHDLRTAYDRNITDYKDTIPELFYHNAMIMLANGHQGRAGALTSHYRHFHEWKRLAEADAGVVDWQTMLLGMCAKEAFMDLFENFIVFDAGGKETRKILARNHQVLGVNAAFAAVQSPQLATGKLGVFWHTQGSGKSYSMAFLSRKIHRKLPGAFTFLILTDRQELDRQIYKTFAGVGAASEPKEACQAASGPHLKQLLAENHPYIFSLIHKFNQPDTEPYTTRPNVIVFSDEAHRTQYGRLARNMRQMLPNAAYLGWTGTPLIGGPEDALTREIFGDYVSIYDFGRSVEDGSTVPLYYDNRGAQLRIATEEINQLIEDELAGLDLDDDADERVRRALGKNYMVLTAPARLARVAQDLVAHFVTRWETGKAMLVCLDKLTAVKMYDLITAEWQGQIDALRRRLPRLVGDQEEAEALRLLAWLEETQIRVVVSEEQNEVKTFREWGLDIQGHRKLMKERDLEEEFKQADHPFRLAIVCAMWMTGFDVESLATLYVDKPMRSHTLMQTIARANRVAEGKPNGLIVDYNGILHSLRRALATYGGWRGDGLTPDQVDPVNTPEERLAGYAAALAACVDYLAGLGCDLAPLVAAQGFDKLAQLDAAVEALCRSDNTRAEFEVRVERLQRLADALIDRAPDLLPFKPQHDALDAIGRRLRRVGEESDINAILAGLHGVVTRDIGVEVTHEAGAESERIFDISSIDFERLRREFARSGRKNTLVQELEAQIGRKLARMLRENPTRLDLYTRYQAIIAAYNQETDRVTIEQTFADLLGVIAGMSEEERRAVREGLAEEHLAIYDLLCGQKEDLTPQARKRVKTVAQELVAAVRAEIAAIHAWRANEITQAQVRSLIYDFLYDERTGLPDAYSPEEIEPLSGEVYRYVFVQFGGAVRAA